MTLHETDEIKLPQSTNDQHSNGVINDANDYSHTNGNLNNSLSSYSDSSNSNSSNDQSNIDNFSIPNDKAVSNGNNDNDNGNDNDNDKVIVIGKQINVTNVYYLVSFRV